MNKGERERKPGQQLDFEKIFKQNEKRIHYHINRLGIRDPYREYYTEGMYALWRAYKKYNPNKGALGTYFNYMIRNRLIDKMRKENRTQENNESIVAENKEEIREQNRRLIAATSTTPAKRIEKEEMWQEVKDKLTEKQWNWVYYHIIQGMTLKEIATLKGVSVEAVKSWGKEARKKLRAKDGGTGPLSGN